MRAYTPTHLRALWFCGIAACTDQPGPTDAGSDNERDAAPPAAADAGDPDAGPVQCDTTGLWQITFDETGERCLPRDQPWTYELAVELEDIDITTESPGAESECGLRRRTVTVTSDGCTVHASTLGTSCMHSEPQCQEIVLDLKIEGNTADVTGSYRRCWCNSPNLGGSWMGSTIPITGKATRM